MTESPPAAHVPAQRASDAPAAVEAYLAAWNAHDAAAVVRIVQDSYVDPTLPGPVSGDELAAYVDGLCAAFPDLHFDAVGIHVSGDTATLQWRMRGTNSGTPLPGAPAPTNGTCDLTGVDVITIDNGAVQTVTGYFDQKTFVEQLGLQALVVPRDEWPMSFGFATRVDLGNTTTPGAFTMTWIETADAEFGELGARTQEIVTALASEPGFIGFEAAGAGGRFHTFAAWASPEAAEAALARNAPHNSAKERVLQQGFATRGFTSIWRPYRLNAQLVRCACGRLGEVPAGDVTGTCDCGQELSIAPYM